MELVIFIQAPADIPYFLEIYEKHKSKRIIIYVVNVENVYRFIVSLNLDIYGLYFIPYKLIGYRNIWKYCTEFIRIRNIWKTMFTKISMGCEVIFFSRYEDWLTAFFIVRLIEYKSGNIIYYNHYDNNSCYNDRRIDFKIFVGIILLYYLCHIKFRGVKRELFPEFPIEKYNIKIIYPVINLPLIRKYYYVYKSPSFSSYNVLLLFSECNQLLFDQQIYNTTILDFFLFLRQKYSMLNYVLKPHPRLGVPKFMTSVVDDIIPEYIPSEFIDPSSFCFCIGVDSTALGHFALHSEILSYSIIDLIKCKNNEMLDSFKRYLIEQSQGHIKFAKSLDDISLKSVI